MQYSLKVPLNSHAKIIKILPELKYVNLSLNGDNVLSFLKTFDLAL